MAHFSSVMGSPGSLQVEVFHSTLADGLNNHLANNSRLVQSDHLRDDRARRERLRHQSPLLSPLQRRRHSFPEIISTRYAKEPPYRAQAEPPRPIAPSHHLTQDSPAGGIPNISVDLQFILI